MLKFFDWLQRKRHAKGFGIHSPFAFDMITKIIPEGKYTYYAYADIARLLSETGVHLPPKNAYYRLCNRLVHHFQPRRILEVNSGNGIQSLFITASDSSIDCYCMENDAKKREMAKRLLAKRQRNTLFIDSLDEVKNTRFDAIFIQPDGDFSLSAKELLSISHEQTFWVIHPIKTADAKHFWKKIVNEDNVRITFEKKRTGIVFLNPSYHKLNYLI